MNVSASTDIVPYVEANPGLVIKDADLRGRFFARLETELSEFKYDLSTTKGRDAIKSFARRFATTKTAIDAAGVEMKEEAQAVIDAVNAVRREAKTKLDDMRDRARAPLTQWEEEEEERKKKHAEIITFLQQVTIIYESTTSAEVYQRLEQLRDVPDTTAFVEAKQAAIETLTAAGVRIKQQEADREELRQLREAKAKAEAEKEALERKEAARVAAELQAKESEQRRQREAKEAEERREREAKALEERIQREREEAAKQAAEAERRRAEAAEQARLAAEKKAADEEEKRAQNKRHRKTVEGLAVRHLLSAIDIDSATAHAVVAAIAEGKIPNVSIQY
jgi:septal ring factor EnvC (AmiA/AmiB activator)